MKKFGTLSSVDFKNITLLSRDGIMAIQKRIVCTEQVPIGNAPDCARIVAVGTNTDGSEYATEYLSLDEVILQMCTGVVFYTHGELSKIIAYVEEYWCLKCSRYHIRSKADAVYDNNLDFLRYCSWKKVV